MSKFIFQSSTLNFVASEAAQQNRRHWLDKIEQHSQLLQNNKAQSWLLFEPDTYQFSILFFALLLNKKHIVLPQNAQENHLSEIKQYADASIGCLDIKPDIHFQTEPNQTLSVMANSEQELELELELDSSISFFTSGSTGKAKRIDKKLSQLITEIDVLEQQFSAQVKGSSFISTVSHQHIYGLLFKLLWPMLKGHSLICQAYEYPEHISAAIEKYKLLSSTLVASPAHLQRVCQDNVLKNVKENITTIFSSGGPLKAEYSISLQQELNCKLIEVFGSTETGGIAWRQRQSSQDEAWTAFDDIKIKLSSTDQRLCLKSPYIIEQGFYLTDDRVKLLENNQFTLLGRVDRVVKIEEKRVSLDEVQNKLIEHNLIRDAHILVISKKRRQLACVAVLSEEGERQLTQLSKFKFDRLLKSHLSAWFEAVVQPKKFRYVETLPYNAQGKLMKQQLEMMFD